MKSSTESKAGLRVTKTKTCFAAACRQKLASVQVCFDDVVNVQFDKALLKWTPVFGPADKGP
jgi:hypothetical protein